jgi:hypothetical protein
MSTRSKIGILKSNGTVDAIYCHWDGYPSYNGRVLVACYTKEEQIRKLISLGDISSLAPSLDEVESYYGWREEERPKRTYSNVEVYENAYGSSWDEYNYLFKNGEWYVFDGNESIDGWKKVKDILKNKEEDE